MVSSFALHKILFIVSLLALTTKSKTSYIFGKPIHLTFSPVSSFPVAKNLIKFNLTARYCHNNLFCRQYDVIYTPSKLIPLSAKNTQSITLTNVSFGSISNGSLTVNLISFYPDQSRSFIEYSIQVYGIPDNGTQRLIGTLSTVNAFSPSALYRLVNQKIFDVSSGLKNFDGITDQLLMNTAWNDSSINVSDPRLWVYILWKFEGLNNYKSVATCPVLNITKNKDVIVNGNIYRGWSPQLGRWTWLQNVSAENIGQLGVLVGIRESIGSNVLRYMSVNIHKVVWNDGPIIFVDKNFGLSPLPQNASILTSLNPVLNTGGLRSTSSWAIYVSSNDGSKESYILCGLITTENQTQVPIPAEFRTVQVGTMHPKSSNITKGGILLPPNNYSVYVLFFPTTELVSYIQPGSSPYRLIQSEWIVKPSMQKVLEVVPHFPTQSNQNETNHTINYGQTTNVSLTITSVYSPVLIDWYFRQNSSAPWKKAIFSSNFVSVVKNRTTNVSLEIPGDIVYRLNFQAPNLLRVQMRLYLKQCGDFGSLANSTSMIDFELVRADVHSTSKTKWTPLVIGLICGGGVLAVLLVCCGVYYLAKRHGNSTDYQSIH